VKIRFKNESLINWREQKKEKTLAEIQAANRYQQEIFNSLNDQVENDSIVRIIDKVIDKLYEKEDEAEEKRNRSRTTRISKKRAAEIVSVRIYE
jgi:hypothetical protein